MHVLVTGANGHLGTNLISALLANGHRVRGSIRSLTDRHKAAGVSRQGAVEVVEARLDDEASLRAAMDGVDAVMHTAAIYQIYAPDNAQTILEAGIDGVAAAMRAAKDAAVSKVVLTSSVVALPLRRTGDPPATEADWADDLRVPYLKAKTLGEKRAWEIAEALGVNLATILPGAFGGPGFERPTPTIDFIEAIMYGAFWLAAPALNYPYIDVRDVVRAHVLALERDGQGRFIATLDRQPMMGDIAKVMHEIDPRVRAPLFTLPGVLTPVLPAVDALNARAFGMPRSITPDLAGTLSGRLWNVSNAKIRRELGWEPQISLRDSLADTMAAVRASQADHPKMPG